jgi:hypothetical protein
LRAPIIGSERVTIIAGLVRQYLDAAQLRVTRELGTNPRFAALDLSGSQASPGDTGIHCSARVAIVTRGLVEGGMQTAQLDITGIARAGIAIIASHRSPAFADAGRADIAGGAGVPIVAGDAIDGVGTSGIGLTGVIGAGILVIAINRGAEALAAGTDISRCTQVAIVAIIGIGRELATDVRVAQIVGAGIVVGAG